MKKLYVFPLFLIVVCVVSVFRVFAQNGNDSSSNINAGVDIDTSFIPFTSNNDSVRLKQLLDYIEDNYSFSSNNKNGNSVTAKKSIKEIEYDDLLKKNEEWGKYAEQTEIDWNQKFYNYESKIFNLQWELKNNESKINRFINNKNLLESRKKSLEAAKINEINYKSNLYKRKEDINNEYDSKIKKLPYSIVEIGQIIQPSGIKMEKCKQQLVNNMIAFADSNYYQSYKSYEIDQSNGHSSNKQVYRFQGDATIGEDYYTDLTSHDDNNDAWITKIIRFNVLPVTSKITSEKKAENNSVNNYQIRLFYYDYDKQKICLKGDNSKNCFDINDLVLIKKYALKQDGIDFAKKLIEKAEKHNIDSDKLRSKYKNKHDSDRDKNEKKIKIEEEKINKIEEDIKKLNNKISDIKDSTKQRKNKKNEIYNQLMTTKENYKKHNSEHYILTNRLKTWNIDVQKLVTWNSETYKSIVLKDVVKELAKECYYDKNKELRRQLRSNTILKINSNKSYLLTRKTISYMSDIIGFNVISLNLFSGKNDGKYVAVNIAFKSKLKPNSLLEKPNINNNPSYENNYLFSTTDVKNNEKLIKWYKYKNITSYVDFTMDDSDKSTQLPDINMLIKMVEAVKDYVFNKKGNNERFIKKINDMLKYPVISKDKGLRKNTYKAIEITNIKTYDYKIIDLNESKICSIFLVKYQ